MGRGSDPTGSVGRGMTFPPFLAVDVSLSSFIQTGLSIQQRQPLSGQIKIPARPAISRVEEFGSD
jgi:hypothetical protein